MRRGRVVLSVLLFLPLLYSACAAPPGRIPGAEAAGDLRGGEEAFLAGEYERAAFRLHMHIAGARDPECEPYARLLRGLCLLRLGRLDKACPDMDYALSHRFPPDLHAAALLAYAEACYRGHRYEKALDCFRQVEDDFPGRFPEAQVRDRIRSCLLTGGRVREALAITPVEEPERPADP
jgi:tetratricopeptide (TPR) repeat protein